METSLTVTSLTTNEAAVVGAAFGGMLGIFGAIGIAVLIVSIIAMWKIFEKAGEKGWKALIPIYNTYILFKISGMKNWFWALFIVAVVVGILGGVGSTNGWVVTTVGDYGVQVTSVTNPVVALINLAASIFEIVVYIFLAIKLAKVFKRGAGTAIGLIFLPFIFMLILAFGSAKYDKKALKN